MLRLLVLWFAVLAPAAAFAQAGDDEREPAGYRAAIDAAVQEHELNHFAESREHFARAHALYPNARTLRALGMVAFELKRYSESARYLTDALASRERTLEGDKRAQTEKLLARANGYLARFALDIAPRTGFPQLTPSAPCPTAALRKRAVAISWSPSLSESRSMASTPARSRSVGSFPDSWLSGEVFDDASANRWFFEIDLPVNSG